MSSIGDEKANELLYGWWSNLDERRGEWAKLRRSEGELEAFTNKAFARLCDSFENNDVAFDHNQLSAPAATIALVRTQDNAENFAQTLGRPDGDQPTVTEQRFERLLQYDDRWEVRGAVRDVLGIVDQQAPVISLFNDLYYWGDSVKKDWAIDYYRTAPL